MPEQPGAGRLDPETLAAYMDGLLPPEERAKVDAEIAADPETYEWMVNTLEAVDDDAIVGTGSQAAPVPVPSPVPIPSPTPRPPLPFHRRRTVQAVVGTLLATAAALVMVVRTQPVWWQGLWGPAVDPRFAKLVEAVGEERYIEARLTGGFKYGPMRQVMRGPGDLSSQNLQLLAAAGELQKAAEREPTAENLHAWGVAQVLLGRPSDAIGTLTDALQLRESAEILNDLACAHLQHHRLNLVAESLPAALEFSERAIAAAPALMEAKFSRATALQEMGLNRLARDAWLAYLEADQSSLWAVEARRRIAALSPDASSTWQQLKREALQAERSQPIDIADRLFPEESVTLLLGEMIPDYFAKWSRGAARDADLKRCLWLAQAIGGRTGDWHLVDVVNAELSRAAQVEGAAFTGRALMSLDSNDYGSAAQAANAARTLLSPKSPLYPWVRLASAQVSYAQGNVDESVAALDALVTDVSASGNRLVLAHAQLLRGISRFGVGLTADAKGDYEQAIELFRSMGEPRSAALALINLSVLHRVTGNAADSWTSRLEALAAWPTQRRIRYYGALLSTAVSASLGGYDNVAISAINEALDQTQGSLPPHIVGEGLAQRARIFTRAGQVAQAAIDLRAARALGVEVHDQASQGRLLQSVLTAEADALRFLEPRSALEAAITAEKMAENRGETLRQAELLLYQGRALGDLGMSAEAEAAFERGRTLVSKAATSQALSRALSISARDPVWELDAELFDQIVSGQTFDKQRALLAFESSRQRTAFERRKRVDAEWARLIDLSRHNTAIVMLRQRTNDLLVWEIFNGRDRIRALPLSRAHASVIERNSTRDAAQNRSSESAQAIINLLFDDLFALVPFDGTIVIVPDGPLGRLPWAAQRDRHGEWLIKRWALVVAADVATTLPVVDRAKPGTGQAVIFGVSERADSRALASVSREAHMIATKYDHVEVLLDREATREAFLARSRSAAVVHVASHAVLSADYPLMSRLLLGSTPQDGDVTAEQIAVQGQWHGATVVLAACSSLGRPRDDFGTVGIGWAFMQAGADRVIGTLWAVGDDSAAALFVGLHERLSSGVPAHSAVRLTQLHAIEQNMPIGDWAGLQVMGRM